MCVWWGGGVHVLCWWVDDGRTLNAGWVVLYFPGLEGVHTSIPKETYTTVCVWWGGGVHVLYWRVHDGPTLNAGSGVL